MLKKVAIVGRPNVGKSTFFNRLTKSRLSITKEQPGVTRDRIISEASWKDLHFELIDTGGLTFAEHGVEGSVQEQAKIAIREADIVLFIVDGSEETTYEDEKIADLLRRTDKPVYVIANKADKLSKRPESIYQLYGLGFDKVIAVSAEHGTGVKELMEELRPLLKIKDVKKIEKGIKVAIVGRPNAGKSSLVNAILGENRNIVSEVAGTTRDTTSSKFKFQETMLELLDTAGIRKKARVDEDIEYYSVVRAVRTIRDADVVVIVIDRAEGVKEQDQKIAGLTTDAKKPVVIALNKIDLPYTNDFEDEKELIKEKIGFTNAPIMEISSLTKKGLGKLLEKVVEVHEQNHKRIGTSILNDVLREIIISQAPPARKGKRVKINYVTQVSVAPPTFLFFCNQPEMVHFSYLRRIENKLREAFGFEGVNIRIRLRRA